MKKWIGVFALALTGVAAGVGISEYMNQGKYEALERKLEIVAQQKSNNVRPASFDFPAPTSIGSSASEARPRPFETPDFIGASTKATPAVVHIRSTYESSKNSSPTTFEELFGGRGGQSSGSGVIISSDGFIATNNHVIEKAKKVEVTLEDKRTYIAEVIGTDPTTDLALLKVEEENLASLAFANSNSVQIGEWVLAVGNPFNLTSTVTAGIVSAKGRSLNLLDEEFAIESFIQTDAAVNPGNSGGALINIDGDLVGINTAIASETGSFAGYSFAVPANIVSKVMKDLREFGEVQRGIIGVQIRNINAQFAEDRNLTTLNGAYVSGIIPGSAAAAGGVERGDVIVQVDDEKIGSSSELQEVIGTYRPGDAVRVKIIRDGEAMTLKVILRNKEGKTQLGARRTDDAEQPTMIASEEDLGATLAPLSTKDKYQLGVDEGVKVLELMSGKLKEAGIEKGFVITKVNEEPVKNAEEVVDQMNAGDGSFMIEGLTEDGRKMVYAFDE